jgi:sugar lactone lactonase YvrE
VFQHRQKQSAIRRTVFAAIVLIAFLAAFVAFSQETNTAKKQLAHLRESVRAARQSGDKQAYLQAVIRLQDFLNDRPATIEAAAQAYAELGDTSTALVDLKRFVDSGQADDDLISDSSKHFAALQKLLEYKSIVSRMENNKAAITHATAAFDLSDPGLLAEDIDYDPQSKTFLITSVLETKIIRVDLHGEASTFAASPSKWPMLTVKVDAARKLAWATEVALNGFAIVPKAEWGKSAVLCFALDTGKLIRRIDGPSVSALGDMVLTRAGIPIVSDGDGGTVYQVHGDKLETVNADDFISPQTAAVDARGHIFVPDYLRGIGVLDAASKRIGWMKQTGSHALDGIDGLYADGDWLIATQNGTSPERVVRFRMNSSHTRIVSEDVIESATPTLGDPTHGVIVDDSFYYIANSGWDALDDHGNLKPGAKLTPAHIMRFFLKRSLK